ncbi:hypothetical protein WT07_28135 [Burkholderia stagnalis]|nr:hypothetical protein WT07_28135 [Burkholderia stagnalis]KWE13434.1 hypothetical protein WT47_03240 [Burkholderia stagnalis]KWE17105.1 hypothetical protein WT48_14855 [Burkholderia stagnalis]KWO82952.1 hypothetical protein WU00_30630 [Burkholderia stagnalis]
MSLAVQHAVAVTNKMAKFVRRIKTTMLGRLDSIQEDEGTLAMPNAECVDFTRFNRKRIDADPLGLEQVNQVTDWCFTKAPHPTKRCSSVFRRKVT